MTQAAFRHVESEALAAFIDGTLPPSELKDVITHLKSCTHCALVVKGAAAFDAEERVVAMPRRAAWWMALAAGVLIAAVLGAPYLRLGYGWLSTGRANARLAAAVEKNGRTIPGRLTGFPWARKLTQRAGADDPTRSEKILKGIASKVLDEVEPSRRPDEYHLAGVAHLISGDSEEAVEALQTAATATGDAEAWADLAAALDAQAMIDGRYANLPTALSAADKALEIQPSLAEAAFNRALILEHLGLHSAARKQWLRHNELDPSSNWNVEASAHVAQIDRQRQALDFDRLFEVAAATGHDALIAFTTAYPQEGRTRGEGPRLAAWAKAQLAGDAAAAAAELSVVETIGRAVLDANGDGLLTDVVTAIQRANSTGRRELASGHMLYHEARTLLRNRDYAASEVLLLRAASLFAQHRSAMADVASYYAAIAVFNQNRGEVARARLVALIRRADPDRTPALYAQELWQIGLCDATAGSWNAAVDDFTTSAETLAKLRETRNEIQVRGLLADALDHIGQSDEAWRQRAHVLDQFSRRGDESSVHGILAGAIRSGIRQRRYAAAASLANMAVDDLRGGKNPVLLGDALLQRARIDAEQGLPASTLNEARSVVATIRDAALRQRSESDLLLVQGIAERRSDPRRAIASIDKAVDFYTRNGFAFALVDAYLQRARALSDLGEVDRAQADLEGALAELDRQRALIPEDAVRSRFFNTAPQAFEELIALHLKRNDLERAFATAERAHARTLRETLAPRGGQPTLASVRDALPTGAALIEYALVPTGVAILSVTANQAAADQIPIDRSRLTAMVANFREAIQQRRPIAEIDRAGDALAAILVWPVYAKTSGNSRLIIVADRELEDVPFAALRVSRNGPYLAEREALTFAPSASLLSRTPSGPFELSLFVGNPRNSSTEELPEAQREVVAAATRYQNAIVLTGDDASLPRFRELAPRASLIVFAGHARGTPPALHFAPHATDDGLLRGGEISRLSLPRTRLVVLAGCTTARSTEASVEGSPSLARAFMTAGVPTVIGTLWNVDDQPASAVFRTIYEALSAGQPPAQATQWAQIQAIRSADPLVRHPATWAAIEVMDIAGER